MFDDFQSLARMNSRQIWILTSLLAISVSLSTTGETQFARGQNNQNDPPLSVTIQQPSLGVSIDAQGVLSTVVFSETERRLQQSRAAAAQAQLLPALKTPSASRKISLRRLEAVMRSAVESGQEITAEMQNLVGLTSIEYVYVMPEYQDILISGSAEPWVENLAGQTIGTISGKPVVLLADWIAALRRFASSKSLNSWVAVSIDPTAQGLENLKMFNRELARTRKPHELAMAAESLAVELRQRLGLYDVRVYGIDPRTHAAHVMIAADYRMKLMAVGLESPPVPMKTFASELKGAPRDIQRWWLTPDYRCLLQAADGLAVQVHGGRVVLQTESMAIGLQGQLQRGSTKPSRAALTYADSFTEHYESLAAASPVFAQLRNVMDGFILSAWLSKTDAYRKAGWRPSFLLDADQYWVANRPLIKQTTSFANILWRDGTLLLPAGGGVSITAAEALTGQNLMIDANDSVTAKAARIELPQGDRWWWD